MAWLSGRLNHPHSRVSAKVSKIVLYHGDDKRTPPSITLDPERGLYFTTDTEYAQGYGKYLHKARVTIKSPAVFTEEESQGDMELDRRSLMADGYDSRVVLYDDGNMDVIVFDLSQVMWL